MRIVTAALVALSIAACAPATPDVDTAKYLSEIRQDPEVSSIVRTQFTDEDLVDLGHDACKDMDRYSDFEVYIDDVLDFILDGHNSGDPEGDFMDMMVVAYHAAESICPRNWPMVKAYAVGGDA